MRRALLTAVATGRPNTRRALLTAVALTAAVLTAAPAAVAGDDGDWTPVVYTPRDFPAGERCPFAFRTEPVLNEVMVNVVERYPDGSSKTELYKGDLIVRVTNTETGAFVDEDASGRAMIEYAADRSETWHSVGPALIGVPENPGNLPRGEWVIDGVWTFESSRATGARNVTWEGATRSLTDVCALID